MINGMRTIQEQHTREEGNGEFQIMTSNLRQVVILPVVRQEANNQEQGGAAAVPNKRMPYASTFFPNQHRICILWEEYENGIGGYKAS
jgi:hypothetical protein